MINLDNLEDIHGYWKMRLQEIEEMNSSIKNKNPWIHLCIATYIAYLANLVVTAEEPRKDRKLYEGFITRYLSKVNAKYNLDFSDARIKFPTLMYRQFRSGIVHSMSFGKNRKISILHEDEARTTQIHHLDVLDVTKQDVRKTVVLLVAEQLLNDLKLVLENIFSSAKEDKILRLRIISQMKKYPPIEGGWEIVK